MLEAHPDVRHAVAVGEPDEVMGERVAAFVEATPTFDLDAARAWFAARGVARFKTPERVVVVDALAAAPDGQARPDGAARPPRAMSLSPPRVTCRRPSS